MDEKTITLEEKVEMLSKKCDILEQCIRGLIKCNDALTNQVRQLAYNQITTGKTVNSLIEFMSEF